MSTKIGPRIKKARLEMRLSQERLGGGTYTKSYICQLEKGKTRPSLKALQHISKALNKPISYFCAEPEITNQITDEVAGEKEMKFFISSAKNFTSKGDYSSALDSLAKAEVINIKNPTQHFTAIIRRHQGIVKMFLHEWDDSEGYFEESLEYYLRKGEAKEIVEIYLNLAQMGVYQQDLNKARKYFRKAKHWGKKYGIINDSILLDIARGYGTMFWIDGDIGRALRTYKKALKHAEIIAEPEKLAEVYVNLGLALKDSNKTAEALEFSYKALALFDLVNNERKKAHVGVNLGIIYFEKGKYEKSLNYLNESFATYNKLGDWKSKADTLTEISKAYVAKGDLKTASKKVRAAISLSEEFGDEVEKARGLSVMAQIALKKDDYQRARKLYKECIEILEKHEINVELTKALQSYSELLLVNEESKKDNLYLEEAIAKLGLAFK